VQYETVKYTTGRLHISKTGKSHILSLQSMINRHLGLKVSNNKIKRLEVKDIEVMFDSADLLFMASNNILAIKFLSV